MNELYIYWSDWAVSEIEKQFINWIEEDEFNWEIDGIEAEINIQTVELNLLNEQ